MRWIIMSTMLFCQYDDLSLYLEASDILDFGCGNAVDVLSREMTWQSRCG